MLWLIFPGGLALLLASGLLFFNRDPQRTPPDDPAAILAPADGLVVAVEQIDAPRWMTGRVWRVAIFLGLMDVHVQRASVAGDITYSEWQAGGYHPALYEESLHNAGHWLGIESLRGRVLILRTAGLIARRVISSVAMGQTLLAGQRIGRILLGSRTEVYLPVEVQVIVKVDQQVKAGESIIARWDIP
jgi:phosphatidylserine decarboxylase